MMFLPAGRYAACFTPHFPGHKKHQSDMKLNRSGWPMAGLVLNAGAGHGRRGGVWGRSPVCAALCLMFAILSPGAAWARAGKLVPRSDVVESQQCAAPAAANAIVNAVRSEKGVIVPLALASGRRPAGFSISGADVIATDASGHVLWKRSLGTGKLVSGFDLDGDGTPDFALAKNRALQKSCGKSVVTMTWLEFYSGATGDALAKTQELEDKCHVHLNYASVRWASSSVLSGGRSGTIALAPQYSSTGWYWRMKQGKLAQDAFLLPSTDSFVNVYGRSDRLRSGRHKRGFDVLGEVFGPNGIVIPFQGDELFGDNEKGDQAAPFIAESHPPNGLIVNYGGEDRLVFFTSGRVLDYKIGRLSAAQLVADQTFYGRDDVAGRNYGVVQFDPVAKDRVAIVSGTHAATVAHDMVSKARLSEPWGNIERHVSVYDLGRNKVNQRFFGSAHDNGDKGKYEKRLVHPAHIFLSAGEGASRIGFNEFTNGVWTFHVTRPGSPEDDKRIPGLFVWDIRDIDGDGIMEIVASPTKVRRGAGDGYFPEWQTEIYAYDKAAGTLALRQSIPGAIPFLAAASVENGTASSAGTLFPVLSGRENATLGLYVKAKAGGVQFAPLALSSRCPDAGAGVPLAVAPAKPVPAEAKKAAAATPDVRSQAAGQKPVVAQNPAAAQNRIVAQKPTTRLANKARAAKRSPAASDWTPH